MAYFKHVNEEDIKWRELHIVRLGLILQKFQI